MPNITLESLPWFFQLSRKDLPEIEEFFSGYLADLEGHSTPQDLKALELELHEGPEPRDPDNPLGLHGWSLNHQGRFDDFDSLPFMPTRYRWQQLTVNTLEASWLLNIIPRKILAPKMRKMFIKGIGPRAETALHQYETTPADPNIPIEEGGLSNFEMIGEILANGESILIALAHAESLDDFALATGPVAIAAATRKPRLVRRVGNVISKTLTRERYLGKEVPKYFKWFSKLFFTIPDTQSSEDPEITSVEYWKIPEEARNIVVSGGMRALFRDIEKGAAIIMAPAGGAMKAKKLTKDGPVTQLEMGKFSENTIRSIGKFTYYLVAVASGEEVNIGSIHRLPDWDKLTKEKGKALAKQEKADILNEPVNNMRREIAQRTANLAKVPVSYTVKSVAEIEEIALPEAA